MHRALVLPHLYQPFTVPKSSVGFSFGKTKIFFESVDKAGFFLIGVSLQSLFRFCPYSEEDAELDKTRSKRAYSARPKIWFWF